MVTQIKKKIMQSLKGVLDLIVEIAQFYYQTLNSSFAFLLETNLFNLSLTRFELGFLKSKFNGC